MLLGRIVDTTALVEVAQALNPINFTKRNKWAISNTDLDKAKELE